MRAYARELPRPRAPIESDGPRLDPWDLKKIENVKIFKKIHFARIRAQNEFSFEKKKESIYGKAIWPRPRLPPQPRPLFAIEAGNFFREIDPEK